MDSLCFSSASILRCDLLARTRNLILMIPVVLEVLFASLLAIDVSRRNLLLICESWAYLLLAILDLLSHVAPQLQSDVNMFRAANIVIGTFSFIPILLYSLFLCSLITLEFLNMIPTKLQGVAKLFCLIFIPLLIGANQFASFIGISYALLPGWGSIVILPTNRDKSLWTFFTSLTLILFTSLQLWVSYFATVRIVRVLRERRRQREYPSISGSPKIGGMTWINIGVLLSAIDAMIGFANGGFGIALARRSLRTASRASLCIGLLIGIDLPDPSSSAEPISLINAKNTSFRRSGLKNLISNPRLSTFRQLPTLLTVPSNKLMALSRRLSNPLGARSTTSDNLFEGKRVTVQFDMGTPKLHLHLSDLGAIDVAALLPRGVDKPSSHHADLNCVNPFSPEKGETDTVSQTAVSRATLLQSATHSTSEHDARLFEGLRGKEVKGKGVMDGEKNPQFLKSHSRGSIREDRGATHDSDKSEDKPLPEVPAVNGRILKLSSNQIRIITHSALTKLTGILRPFSSHTGADEMDGPSFPAGDTSESYAAPRHIIDENHPGQENLSKAIGQENPPKETEERSPNRRKGPASRTQSLPAPSQSAQPVQALIGDSVKRNSLWINREVHIAERTPPLRPRLPSSSTRIRSLPPSRRRETSGKHRSVEQVNIGTAPQRRTPAPARACHAKARSHYTETLMVGEGEPRRIMIAFTQEIIAQPDTADGGKAMPNHQRQRSADSQLETLDGINFRSQ